MPLSNFGMVVPGQLYRSAQPDAKGFQDIKALGIRKIIKLNSDGEFSVELETKLAGPEIAVVQKSVSTFNPTLDEVVGVLYQIDPAVSTLIHCSHGRDRTGLVVGAYRLEKGWTYHQMDEERRLYGSPLVLEIIDLAIVILLKRFVKWHPKSPVS